MCSRTGRIKLLFNKFDIPTKFPMQRFLRIFIALFVWIYLRQSTRLGIIIASNIRLGGGSEKCLPELVGSAFKLCRVRRVLRTIKNAEIGGGDSVVGCCYRRSSSRPSRTREAPLHRAVVKAARALSDGTASRNRTTSLALKMSGSFRGVRA